MTTANYPIRMRPVGTLRVTNFIGALVIAGCGAIGVWGGFAVGFAVHRGWVLSLLGAPFALYGLVFLFAGLRLELVLEEDAAIVHGYFSTVRIPRGSVRSITSWPAIEWTDDRGRARRSAVNALNIYRSGRASPNAAIVARIEQQCDVLREWAKG